MRRGLLAAVSAVALCGLLIGSRAQAWDIYLEGYQGPYRGRVVDAETKEPIAGAAVVAVWMRDKVYPLHSTAVLYGAREVLTLSDGGFVIDGKDLERSAPTRTRKPYFTVFFPGYASYRSRPFIERGFQSGTMLERAGMTIGLPRLITRKERVEVVAGVRPLLVPDDAIPSLIQLINSET